MTDGIKQLLRNSRFSRGSLYGDGFFPFWVYVKYFGKPAYRWGRKRGFNVFTSLCFAHILGALFHVAFFIGGLSIYNVIVFTLSFAIFPASFFAQHKSTGKI